MKRPTVKLFLIAVFLFCGLFLLPKHAFALTFTSSATGNWNLGTTWGGACASGCVAGTDFPGSADTAIIATTKTVTVTANQTVSALTFGTTASAVTAGVVSVNSGVTLTVTNAITMTGTAGTATTGTIQDGTGAGTITAASVQIGVSVTPSATVTNKLIATITTFTVTNGITLTGFNSNPNRNNPEFDVQAGKVSATSITTSMPSANNTALVTLATGAQTGYLKLSSATPWTISGTGTTTTTLNGTGATVEYSGAAVALRIVTYQNLLLSGSGSPTGSLTNVSGNMTMSGTVSYTDTVGLQIAGNLAVGTGTALTANNGTVSLAVTGTTTVDGSLSLGIGAATFTGLLLLDSGASFSSNSSGSFTVSGGMTNNSGGTLTISRPVTLNAAENIGGANNITFGSTVTVSGAIAVTNTNTATVTVTGTLNGSVAGSSWIQGTNSDTVYLSATQPMATGTLDGSANTPNTFEYNANGTQTIEPAATAYYNLVLGGTGTATKTAGGALTVNGDFTIGGNATFAGGTSLTHTFLGNWIVSTTAGTSPYSFTTAGTINFNTPGTPAATQISGSPTTIPAFNIVNINNTSGFSINTNITSSGTVTVATGVTVTPGASNTLGGAGTLTGAGTAIINVTRTAATADLLNQYTITTITLTNLEVDYVGTAAQTVDALTTYSTLKVMPGANSVTHTFATAPTTVSGNITFGDGTHTSDTVTAATNNTTLTVSGNVTIASGTTFIANATNATTIAGNWTNNGTFTHSNGTVVFGVSGGPSNTGLTNSGTGTDTGIGGTAWTSPGNIAGAPDTAYASVTLAGGVSATSAGLKATNYGFSIPSNATITGIAASITRHDSGSGIEDLFVQLMKAGVPGGSSGGGSLWGTSDSVGAYGSASDLWGQTWTPSDINNSGFGLYFQVDNASGVSRSASVDSIQLTVYYTFTTTQNLTGATTFYDFTDTTAGSTLKFHAGDIFTFAHNFTVTGTASNVNIQSDTPSSQWKAHFTLAQPTSVTFSTITDSGCDPGTQTATVTSANNDTDGGGNDTSCWAFVTAAPAIIDTHLQGGIKIQGGTKIR